MVAKYPCFIPPKAAMEKVPIDILPTPTAAWASAVTTPVMLHTTEYADRTCVIPFVHHSQAHVQPDAMHTISSWLQDKYVRDFRMSFRHT